MVRHNGKHSQVLPVDPDEYQVSLHICIWDDCLALAVFRFFSKSCTHDVILLTLLLNNINDWEKVIKWKMFVSNSIEIFHYEMPRLCIISVVKYMTYIVQSFTSRIISFKHIFFLFCYESIWINNHRNRRLSFDLIALKTPSITQFMLLFFVFLLFNEFD